MSSQYLPNMYRSASKENNRSISSRANDVSLSPMTPLGGLGSVGTVKKARKKMENDAMLLANRIALLKQEELKAWRKIEDMKKKAQDIYFMKRRNEERQREKQINTISHRGMMKESQIYAVEMREKQKQERQNILAAVYTQKKKDMMEIKKQKEKNESKKNELKKIILKENIAKSQSVKEQEFLSAQRKQEFMDNKLRVLKNEKERQLLHEDGIRRKKELEILTMEKMEMELVRKLEQTQQLQRAAFEELETAMTQPADIYSAKFFGGTLSRGQGSTSARHILPPMKLNPVPVKNEPSFDSDSNRSIDREEQLNMSKDNKASEMTMRIEETNEEYIDNTHDQKDIRGDESVEGKESVMEQSIESVEGKKSVERFEESVEDLTNSPNKNFNNIKVVESEVFHVQGEL